MHLTTGGTPSSTCIRHLPALEPVLQDDPAGSGLVQWLLVVVHSEARTGLDPEYRRGSCSARTCRQ
ncbi:uncharacterized protein J3R85_004576 [Psidium guajava]|nr:uncharacterized protein J3R85_004576 [Psidium guajava]